jgi:hypothetical protein
LGVFSYQWQASSDNGSNWSNISGATEATYTVGNYAGQSLQVIARYVDGGRVSETVTSNTLKVDTNVAPVLTAPATLTIQDVTPAATDTFTHRVGQLSATDSNGGDTLTYSISGVTSAKAYIYRDGQGYDTTQTQTYGTLYLNSQTGSYVYVPDATKINALTSTASDSFTLTVSDGVATATNTSHRQSESRHRQSGAGQLRLGGQRD